MPSSYIIETGKFETSTRIDGIAEVNYLPQGVELVGDEECRPFVKAFLPYGTFTYIKQVDPPTRNAQTSHSAKGPCANPKCRPR